MLRRFLGDGGTPPSWDDKARIRAELFSVERLEEHSRSLAAAQAVTPDKRKGASLAKQLTENEAVLVAAYRDIAEAVDTGAAGAQMACPASPLRMNSASTPSLT